MDGNHFFRGGRRYSNSTDPRGVLVRRPMKSGMGDVLHSSLSGVTGGLPVSVFYVVDFDVLAADFTSVDKF